jgi:ribosomal protein L30E
LSLNIVEADIKDLKKSRSRGRVRSEETKALIAAIDSLTSGKAKAIKLEAGQDPAKMRAKLAYAAKVAGKKLKIVVEQDRILFARGPGRPRKRA